MFLFQLRVHTRKNVEFNVNERRPQVQRGRYAYNVDRHEHGVLRARNDVQIHGEKL